MLKKGTLNAQRAGLMAKLGHTDTVVISDCGLPVPADVPLVDLAVVFGAPRFHEVLEPVLAELEIEAVTIAKETPAEVRELIPTGIDDVTAVRHEELKALIPSASFVVRTGETTPYANIVLRCGVAF